MTKSRKKICVYAICKNEEKFAARWARSMNEADCVVVLDTGSDDNTVNILKDNGVYVEQKVISPWRFDVARNESMELIPPDTDICVCTDLDEVFEPGWREKLEKSWQPQTTSARYRYTWNFNPDGSEGTVLMIEKAHKYGCYKWINPVHEVLKYEGDAPQSSVTVQGIQLNHFADDSKSRAQYLPLLELAVSEDPQNDRNMHYLGREYMFKGRWNDAIKTLERHLQMKNAVWRDERCASMRFIARCKEKLGDVSEAEIWLYKAIAEASHLREPYIDLAYLMYRLSDWYGVIYFAEEALKIKERPTSYICEAAAWGSDPYDMLSIAYYHTGDYKKALEMCKNALLMSPENERIKNNLQLFETKAN